MKRSSAHSLPTPAEEAFAKIVEAPEATLALRKLLKEITAGPAFKGSQRSGQFLEFVVEQSIAGNFDLLKERLIGVELFKREPSYDTGEDAIVRVTASDVRKRLLQHYGWFGSNAELRIELPLGSYIPRVSRNSFAEPQTQALTEPVQTLDDLAGNDTSIEQGSPLPSALPVEPPPPVTPALPTQKQPHAAWHLWRNVAIVLLAAVFGWWIKSLKQATPPPAAPSLLPWSALFTTPAPVRLITSDANIDTVQGITRVNLSLSDYANHNFLPTAKALTPEQLYFCKLLLLADSSTPSPDLPITVRIAQLAQTYSKKLLVQTARSFQLSSLGNNDNFIFLGSPRSNPWFSVFTGALDFQFVFNPEKGSELIRNLHPRSSEQATYIPSANGGGTGYSFAIIAFVQNPDQVGEVLLLAGADGEATGAAGEFVTDNRRMSAALQKCGITASGPARHFELLLQTDTMAGVSRKTDIIACHLLPGTPGSPAPTSRQ